MVMIIELCQSLLPCKWRMCSHAVPWVGTVVYMLLCLLGNGNGICCCLAILCLLCGGVCAGCMSVCYAVPKHYCTLPLYIYLCTFYNKQLLLYCTSLFKRMFVCIHSGLRGP